MYTIGELYFTIIDDYKFFIFSNARKIYYTRSRRNRYTVNIIL